MVLKIEPFRRAPLSPFILLFGIVLILMASLWLWTLSPPWSFALAVLGAIFIVASLVSISPGPR